MEILVHTSTDEFYTSINFDFCPYCNSDKVEFDEELNRWECCSCEKDWGEENLDELFENKSLSHYEKRGITYV